MAQRAEIAAFVFPAKAGIQGSCLTQWQCDDWAPAFAGVMRRQLDNGVRRCDEV